MTLFDSGVPYTRLISASGNVQRYRMMRYVMVLGIILVTIFLYVSYYTTPLASVDNRYAAFVSQEQQRLPPIQGNSDQNFFSIAGEEAAKVVEKEREQQQQQQQQPTSQLEETSGPSEATKQNSNSSSSRGGGSEGSSVRNGAVEEPPHKEQASQQQQPVVGAVQVKANLTAGETD